MITWSQRILNETVQSVIGPSRVSGVSDHLFKVASAGMDEGASGIQIFFLPGSTDGALNLFTELRFDKWLRAHQTVLAGDEFKTAVGGLWQDLREGVGEVFFAETGDLSIELEPWFSVGDPIFKLSILSQNPASISPDDYFAEGDCIRCMIGSALRDDRELSSREFKIGTTRLDETGALCVSVRSEEMGAQRPEATVVVTDGFMPDDETRTFIERKKLELGSPFFAEEFLAASLRTKFTGGRGLPEVEISNPDDFEIQILFPSQASSDRQEGSDTALPFSAEVKLVNKDWYVQ